MSITYKHTYVPPQIHTYLHTCTIHINMNMRRYMCIAGGRLLDMEYKVTR